MNTEQKKKTGKREAGWVVFVCVTGIIGWAIWQHSQGVDMSDWISLFIIAWPTAMAGAIGPHVLHHVRPPHQNMNGRE